MTPFLALLLGVRCVALGSEQLVLKRLSTGGSAPAATAVFFGVSALLLAAAASGLAWPAPRVLAASLPSGLLYAAAFSLYTWAIARADLSLISPFLNLNAVFVFFFAHFAFGESWDASRWFGLGLIVAGGIWINSGARTLGGARHTNTLALAAALGYAFLSACARLVDKAASVHVPVLVHAAVTHGLVACGALALAALRGTSAQVLQLPAERPGAAVVAGALNAVAFGTFVASLQWLPVSVAEPLSALSSLVAVALGGLVLHEPIGRRLPGALLICVGAGALLGP